MPLRLVPFISLEYRETLGHLFSGMGLHKLFQDIFVDFTDTLPHFNSHVFILDLLQDKSVLLSFKSETRQNHILSKSM